MVNVLTSGGNLTKKSRSLLNGVESLVSIQFLKILLWQLLKLKLHSSIWVEDVVDIASSGGNLTKKAGGLLHGAESLSGRLLLASIWVEYLVNVLTRSGNFSKKSGTFFHGIEHVVSSVQIEKLRSWNDNGLHLKKSVEDILKL